MDLRVAANPRQLAERAARFVRQTIAKALARQKVFSLVLAGGATPLALYERLSRPPYRNTIAWSKVHIFWSDERFVPPHHPHSNYGAARRALIGKIPLPPQNIHPIPTNVVSPSKAAALYEKMLRNEFKKNNPLSSWERRPRPLANPPSLELLRKGGRVRGNVFPVFDLMLLGLGEDGHVASLFPGARSLKERKKWVMPVADAPTAPRKRVTLTVPALGASRRVMFLVSGAAKSLALRELLTPGRKCLPAGQVVRRAKSVVVFADRAAAQSR